MNKKAVSLMISYVLLVVIVLSIATLVYVYLKLYLPVKIPECSDDISVLIEKATCDIKGNQTNVTVRNSGLFNISAMFVRLVAPGHTVGTQLNKGQETLNSIPPGDNKYTYVYNTSHINVTSGTNVIEIQPATIQKGILVVCNSIATQYVTCA